MVAFGFTPLPNLIARSLLVSPELRPADAIVVLGGGVKPDCSLPDLSLRRTVYGVRLFNEGYARVIVFSSGFPHGACPLTQAEAMRRLALALGIPEAKALTEERSGTTHENAVETGKLMRSRGLSSVLLVTTPTHMRRASGAFHKQGMVVYAAPADGQESSERTTSGRLALAVRVGKEVAGLLYYKLKGWL